jgi:hypothetical protein
LNTVEEEYLSLVRGLEGQFLAYNNGGGQTRKEREETPQDNIIQSLCLVRLIKDIIPLPMFIVG